MCNKSVRLEPICPHEVLPAHGGSPLVNGSRWKLRTTMQILGHPLQLDAGTRECWNRALMWCAFFANLRHKNGRRLSLKPHISLLSRAVSSILFSRCARWSPQKTIALEMDALQGHMYAILLDLPRRSLESPQEYCRRRSTAGALIGGKLWSKQWFRRAVSWDRHIKRDYVRQQERLRGFTHFAFPTSWSWAGALCGEMARSWFEQRRLQALRVVQEHVPNGEAFPSDGTTVLNTQ